MSESIWQQLESAAQAMSYAELTAVVLALLYVILAANESIWCWPAALISSGISVYLLFQANLVAESALNIFYVVMAIVGWVQWSRQPLEPAAGRDNPPDSLPIIRQPLAQAVKIISLNLLLTLILGYILDNYLGSANSYVDAFTTVFSLYTTWMVTQKVLENWLYWIVIDAVSIWLYAERELYLYALLFCIYTLLAVIGYWRWRQLFKLQQDTELAA